MPGLADRELDGIRASFDEGLHHATHVFDALQEAALIE